MQDSQTAPAEAQHRVEFVELLHPRERRGEPGALRLAGAPPLELRQLAQEALPLRQELVERRIQRADRDRGTLHGEEEPAEIRALKRQELLQGSLERTDRTPSAALRFLELLPELRALRARRTLQRFLNSLDRELHLARLLRVQDHRDDVRDALLGKEHVLRAAESDSLRPELPCEPGVLRHVRVRANAQPAHLVAPLGEALEALEERRLVLAEPSRQHAHDLGVRGGRVPQQHLAGRAVEGQEGAFAQGPSLDAQQALLLVDRERRAARHAALPHASGHDRGVGGHPSRGRENAARGVHARDVVRRSLRPDQDHPLRGAPAHRLLRGEDDRARGRARRGGGSAREDLVLRSLHRVQHGVQHLIQVLRIHALDRLALGEEPFVHHLDRDPERGLPRAGRPPRLEHEEAPLLDRELEVLHVAVMPLQPRRDLAQRGVGLRKLALHLLDGTRRADPRDHVLSLCVPEILAVELLLPRRRIAREPHAGRGAIAQIPEDHRLHRDRRAEMLRNSVELPVVDRALRVPRAEDRVARPPELLAGVLGELPAALAPDHLLHPRDELPEIALAQTRVVLHARALLGEP